MGLPVVLLKSVYLYLRMLSRLLLSYFASIKSSVSKSRFSSFFSTIVYILAKVIHNLVYLFLACANLFGKKSSRDCTVAINIFYALKKKVDDNWTL